MNLSHVLRRMKKALNKSISYLHHFYHKHQHLLSDITEQVKTILVYSQNHLRSIRISLFFQHKSFTLLLMVAAIALIWYVGPLISFLGKTPLESELDRLVAIFLTLLLIIGLKLKQSRPPIDNTDIPEEELLQLHKNFKSAEQLLKRIQVGQQGSEQSAYELPRYLIIGLANAGKSSLLTHSGCHFFQHEHLVQLAPPNLDTIGHCNWWVTHDAVILDVPGYYLETNLSVIARRLWTCMLDLLQKHHSHVLNGLIITIGADTLIQHGSTELQQLVLQIKQRIQELFHRIHKSFPIYLLVTKIDLIAGFSDFFHDLAKEERTQPWGINLCTTKSRPEFNLVQQFDKEYDALLQRLHDRIIWQLHQENTIKKREIIFEFPLQIEQLKERLTGIVYQISEASRYYENVQLSGIYFCSSDQSGKQIDNLQPLLSTAFELQPRHINKMPNKTQAFFIEDLLKNIIFKFSYDTSKPRTKPALTWQTLVISAALMSSIGFWLYQHTKTIATSTEAPIISGHIDDNVLFGLSEISDTGFHDQDQALRLINTLLKPHSPFAKSSVIVKHLDNLRHYLMAVNNHQAAFDVAKQRALNPNYQDPIIALLQLAKETPAPLGQQLHHLAMASWQFTLTQARQHINRTWQQTVLPFYQNSVKNRYPIFKSSPHDMTLTDFIRFFGPSGILDQYVDTYLSPFIDTTQAKWQSRPIAGRALPLSDDALTQLQRGTIIRKMYFANNSKKLMIPFTLVPINLPASISSVEIEINDQVTEDAPGENNLNIFLWPSSHRADMSRVIFELQTGNPIEISQKGPWSWFRLLEKANLRQTTDTKHFELSFDVRDNTIKYVLVAKTTLNPFISGVTDQFRCPDKL